MSGTGDYSDFFRTLTDRTPYDYQCRVADEVVAGRNVVVHAPTGCGKTYAVVLPYLYQHLRGRGPRRLIYVLPLRTLVESIAREISVLVAKAGARVEVKTQTGEQPNDPFFASGDVIVTTYDQVLSGLLCSPYGLPPRLANINAGLLAGNLVVFDEFHLMEPGRAFVTALACLEAQGSLAQSLWMTATATSPLLAAVTSRLNAATVRLGESDLAAVPSISRVVRHLAVEPAPITVESVLRHTDTRTIVLFNTVARAQRFFEDLDRDPRAPAQRILLHARFFQSHRRAKVKGLIEAFGRESREPAILVATQVVEAGVDITSDHLHTELCPMNSLVQRAGRCARFAPEDHDARAEGTVHVHLAADGGSLPYDGADLDRTWNVLLAGAGANLDPSTAAEWVDAVHGGADRAVIEQTSSTRKRECLDVIAANALGCRKTGVSDLIRAGEDSIRVLVAREPPERPSTLEGVTLRRAAVVRGIRDQLGATPTSSWVYVPGEDPAWIPASDRTIRDAYVLCVTPSLVAYESRLGLRLGTSGVEVSPTCSPARRPGYAPLRRESWVAHTRAVLKEADVRLAGDLRLGSPLERAPTAEILRNAVRTGCVLHDLGKLQERWQRWAHEAQRLREPSWNGAEALAHTDFDPSNSDDRRRLAGLAVVRPNHAPAGAWFGAALVADLVASAGDDNARAFAASAAITAVLAHHGGWLPSVLEVEPLIPTWRDNLASLAKKLPSPAATAQWAGRTDKHRTLQQLLDVTTGPEALVTCWAVVAYVTRTLRLSDQRATAEGSNDA